MSNYNVAYTFQAIDQMTPIMYKIHIAMDNFEKKVDKTTSKLEKLSKSVEKTGKFLFKSLVIPLAAAAVYAFKNAEQFEKMRIKLVSVAGSAKEAARVMESIKRISAGTGLAPESLTNTATKLFAAGFGTSQVNEKLRQMSMFAVVSGRDVSNITASFVRMKQLGAQPRLMAKLSQEGIPLIKAYKEYYQLSDKAWNSLSKKRIDFKLIEPVLAAMTKEGSAFSESYKEMLSTTGVSAERIHETLRIIAGDFGRALLKAFSVNERMKSIADYLDKIQPKVSEWLENNPGLVKMVAIFLSMTSALIGLAASITMVSKALGVLRGIALILHPIVAPLALTIYALAKAWNTFSDMDWRGLGNELLEFRRLMSGGHYLSAYSGVMAGAMQDNGADIGTGFMSNLMNKFDWNLNVSTPTSTVLRLPSGEKVGSLSYGADLGTSGMRYGL